METISFIILILLSLVGYCYGAVAKGGKSVELKPRIIDLILVVLIWGGAIYSRISLALNKWFLILLWLVLSIIIGILATWPRKLPKENILKKSEELQKNPKNLFLRLWQKWKNFSRRMGSFQSRIILSLFFFIFVSPFALAVKTLSDPLRIKHPSSGTHWLSKEDTKADFDYFKRQF